MCSIAAVTIFARPHIASMASGASRPVASPRADWAGTFAPLATGSFWIVFADQFIKWPLLRLAGPRSIPAPRRLQNNPLTSFGCACYSAPAELQRHREPEPRSPWGRLRAKAKPKANSVAKPRPNPAGLLRWAGRPNHREGIAEALGGGQNSGARSGPICRGAKCVNFRSPPRSGLDLIAFLRSPANAY